MNYFPQQELRRNTSRELEALLIEQEKAGYELVSIVPITGNISVVRGVYTNETIGLMITLRKESVNKEA